MAGLVPAISLRKAQPCPPDRDRRDKPGDDEGEWGELVEIGFSQIAPQAAAWSVNWNVAPGPTFCEAHSFPPCASMIERQIESPIPSPLGLVV
jgi:hypothetical protein